MFCMNGLKIQRTKCSDCGRYISLTVESMIHHYRRTHGIILNQRQAKDRLTQRRKAGFYTKPGNRILQMTKCLQCDTPIPWNRDGIIYHFRHKHRRNLSQNLADDLLNKCVIKECEEKTKDLPISEDRSKSIFGIQGGAPGLGRRR